MNTSAVRRLVALLDANARFDLSGKGTTNHCPMALTALASMGATPERLQAFFDRWTSRYALDAPAVDAVIARDAWIGHTGERAAFGALRACFADWIADAGHVCVVTTVLHAMPFAPATLAFHALIRLAYGIEAGHAGEIASGLAAWVSAHLPIDVRTAERPPAHGVQAGFAEIVRAMNGTTFDSGSITSRVQTVAADPRFRNAMQAPPPSASLLDEFARATIDAFWRRPDFTVLHTVTAIHAARIVFRQLPDATVARLLPDLWVALCAAYATVGVLPREAPAVPDALPEWDTLCRLAVESDNDHVIKMVYTCLCESRRDPSPLYRAAAARLVHAGQ